ncbi:MAG TPA: ATP-binding protein [Longimicrobiales bacterium]|nr:ATP-binding protein [Longimicrobiales bacterium]
MNTDLVLELPNDVRTIEHAVEYVMRRCSACEAHARLLRLNFRVGLTEALSNAMLYGNGPDPSKRVRVEITVGESEITARITDQGDGFDPQAVPDPTTPRNITRAGGRGLFLMRKLLDEVSFNDRGNSVTLVLRLEHETGMGGARQA